MNELINGFTDFMAKGGPVLWGLLFLTVLLWLLILERMWFFYMEYPAQRESQLEQWKNQSEHQSWYASLIRTQLISQLDCAMTSRLKVIPAFIALLPMVGLLGTVTGMIQVFDVMANMGSGNPRAMANGVSAATIPTMASMVISLSAIPFSTHLDRRHKRELTRINELMNKE